MLLSQALNTAAMKNPGGAAILDLGQTISFADLRKKVAQLSYLHQAEIGHGKRIAMLSQNNPSAILSFFAFSNIGCPVIFLDPHEPTEGIVEAIRDINISHIAVSGDQAHRANDMIRSHGLGCQVVEIEKKKGGEYDPSYSPPPDHPLKETDNVLILRQAEMGFPTKYIYFTHKQVHAAAAAVRKFYHFGATERVLTTLTWAHPFSLVHGMLSALFASACCAIDPQSASNEEFIDYLASHHISRFADTPKFFYSLLASCMAYKYKLPGVKSVTVGTGPLPKALRKTFGLLQIPVLQTHGRLEALWTIAMEDLEVSRAGKPAVLEGLPGFKYKVLNEGGDEIESEGSREGPLALAGETVMTAYFQPDRAAAEKATKNTIRGTWFYTGEAARLEGVDSEIKLRPLGLLTEVTRAGQRYCLPEPVEEAARELAEVSEAAAFVSQDDKGNSSFVVAIVRGGKGLTESSVLQHIATKVKGAAAPRKVVFVDEIPKDRHGNLNRGALQRQFAT